MTDLMFHAYNALNDFTIFDVVFRILGTTAILCVIAIIGYYISKWLGIRIND